MPLDTYGKRMRRNLQSFDSLIRSQRTDCQIRSGSVYCLVMKAVDIHRTSEIGGQSGRFFNAYGMADVTSGIRMLHMIQTFSRLVTDILIDGSLTGSIKNLHSTADRKDWFAEREYLFHKTDLETSPGGNIWCCRFGRGACSKRSGVLYHCRRRTKSHHRVLNIVSAYCQNGSTEAGWGFRQSIGWTGYTDWIRTGGFQRIRNITMPIKGFSDSDFIIGPPVI